MRAVMALALAILAAQAQAQTVGTHVHTWHERGRYFDVVPHAPGLKCEQTGFDDRGVYSCGNYRRFKQHTIGLYYMHKMAAVGIYGNSIGEVSTWAGGVLSAGNAQREAALTIGVVHGYGGGLKPLIAPSVRLGPVRLSALPKSTQRSPAALHLSLEAKL